jgi:hypothetical protein
VHEVRQAGVSAQTKFPACAARAWAEPLKENAPLKQAAALWLLHRNFPADYSGRYQHIGIKSVRRQIHSPAGRGLMSTGSASETLGAENAAGIIAAAATKAIIDPFAIDMRASR